MPAQRKLAWTAQAARLTASPPAAVPCKHGTCFSGSQESPPSLLPFRCVILDFLNKPLLVPLTVLKLLPAMFVKNPTPPGSSLLPRTSLTLGQGLGRSSVAEHSSSKHEALDSITGKGEKSNVGLTNFQKQGKKTMRQRHHLMDNG